MLVQCSIEVPNDSDSQMGGFTGGESHLCWRSNNFPHSMDGSAKTNEVLS